MHVPRYVPVCSRYVHICLWMYERTSLLCTTSSRVSHLLYTFSCICSAGTWSNRIHIFYKVKDGSRFDGTWFCHEHQLHLVFAWNVFSLMYLKCFREGERESTRESTTFFPPPPHHHPTTKPCSRHHAMHWPMHWPMHGVACPSTKIPISSHRYHMDQHYMILTTWLCYYFIAI